MTAESLTQTFFEKEALQATWYTKDLPTLEKMSICCKHNGEAFRSYIIIGVVMGILAIWAMDPISSSLDLSIFDWQVLTFGAFGLTLLLISAVSYIVMRILEARFVQVDEKGIFLEKDICDSQRKLNGKLILLKNGIPCLMIPNGSDAREAGRTHGFLVANALNLKIKALRWDLWKARFFDSNTKALFINKQLALKMINHLPAGFKEQLEGIVEGYNYWCQDNNKSNKGLTVEELFLFHLIQEPVRFEREQENQPEMKKNSLSGLSFKASNPVACTTFVAKDPKEGMSMMRLLDGNNRSFCHKMTILIATDMGNGIKTLELGFAGMIATYTGMNNKGLGLAMNGSLKGDSVSSYSDPKKLPSFLFNKLLLQEHTLKGVEHFIENENFVPLAAYHLTIADKSDAAVVHFGQKESATPQDGKWRMLAHKHLVRYKQKENPLFVTNPTYVDEGIAQLSTKMGIAVEKDRFGLLRMEGWESFDRENRLQSAWDESKKHAEVHSYIHSPASVVKNVAKIGGINNSQSSHVVHMDLEKRTFSFAVSEHFVGTCERLACSFEDLFSQTKFPYRIKAGKQEEV